MKDALEMQAAIEKLKALRSKNESELQKCNASIGDLEQKAQALAGQNIGLELAIRELSGNETPLFQGVGKYSKMTLTDAIEDVVNAYGTQPGLLTNEIITKLFAEGFQTKAKELYASVYAVAQRLVATGRIDEGKKDGKRSFVQHAITDSFTPSTTP